MKFYTTLAIIACTVMADSARCDDIGNAGFVHGIYSEILNAEDHCSGLAVDVQAWNDTMSRAVSKPQALVKSFQLTEQGAAWFKTRKNEFVADPATNCAQAEMDFGRGGKKLPGLLIRKK